jgi:hypothetical protein
MRPVWVSLVTLFFVAPTAVSAVSTWSGEELTISSLFTRYLAIGDFASFNEALKSVTLKLPDPPPISQQVLFRLRIQLTNVYCQDIVIGDIKTNFTKDSNQELTFDFDADPFAMNCYADYSYDYGGFIRSSGEMTANARNNRARLSLGFRSPSNFAEAPPNQTTVKACDTSIDIFDIELSRGLESVIASIFKDAVSRLVEREAASGMLFSLV